MDDSFGDLLAAAKAIVITAPQIVSRQGGDFGEAWDILVERLEELRHEDLPESAPRRTSSGAVDPEALLHTGLVIASAAEMQSAVDACDDERISGAWGTLKLCLLGVEG